MVSGLTYRLNTVVAANTIAGNIVVIKVGRQPTLCCVAIVAGIPASDMVRWFTFDDDIIVAARTRTNHLQMIYLRNRHKRDHRMTVFADG